MTLCVENGGAEMALQRAAWGATRGKVSFGVATQTSTGRFLAEPQDSLRLMALRRLCFMGDRWLLSHLCVIAYGDGAGGPRSCGPQSREQAQLAGPARSGAQSGA